MGGYLAEEGGMLVKAARHTVELYLKSAKFDKGIMEKRTLHLNEHHGIFVTIRHYPLGSIRGSAAIVKGTKPLRTLIVEAALASAADDKRHLQISVHELEHIVFEVGVISKPIKLKGSSTAMLKSVKEGKEGILLEYGYKTGVILPEEITKQSKTPKLFEELCKRAGLDKVHSKRSDLSFYKFASDSFVEKEPEGEVEKVS